MRLNRHIEVPDNIFLSRWWEVAARAVFFMLGASYSVIFGNVLSEDTYLGIPLALIAVGILFGRHVATRRQMDAEERKIRADVVEMELETQRALALLEKLRDYKQKDAPVITPMERKMLAGMLEKVHQEYRG